MIWRNLFALISLHWQCTVWKFRKFSPTAKIFHQIDLQYNSLVKQLIWRNFCKKSWGIICKFPHCVRVNFSFFHTHCVNCRKLRLQFSFSTLLGQALTGNFNNFPLTNNSNISYFRFFTLGIKNSAWHCLSKAARNFDRLVRGWKLWFSPEFSRKSWMRWDLGKDLSGKINSRNLSTIYFW